MSSAVLSRDSYPVEILKAITNRPVTNALVFFVKEVLEGLTEQYLPPLPPDIKKETLTILFHLTYDFLFNLPIDPKDTNYILIPLEHRRQLIRLTLLTCSVASSLYLKQHPLSPRVSSPCLPPDFTFDPPSSFDDNPDLKAETQHFISSLSDIEPFA